MDFKFVLQKLIAGFARLNIRYAAAGGFALGALGAARLTKDLDFLVHQDDLANLDLLMTSLGYKQYFRSENITQYEGENVVWGWVDFIHAFRPLAVQMLAEALVKPVWGGEVRIRVLRPEDVIGLKVQALANNRAKRAQDAVDIEALALANQETLDWERVAKYYRLFRLDSEFEEMKRRVQSA
ncbi:MAG: nucleotidyltransferase family protein [Elusimicrobia bacterium]|nr:nucleotidyltransferase family protein [Elusimicrobiota bacterium]